MFKVQKPLYKSVFQSELNSYKQLEIITTNPDSVIENVPLTLNEDNITSVKSSAVDNAKELNSINTSKNSKNTELVDKVIDNLSGSKFFDVVETLTRSRSKYPKKTYYNVLYKFKKYCFYKSTLKKLS